MVGVGEERKRLARVSSQLPCEDDGLLLTVLYNASADESSFGVFDAKTMTPLSMWPLGAAVPFHAHGIVCAAKGGGQRCFSNP